MNKAVCVVLENDGKYLAVSRKDNSKDFGFPGGKVDPGETGIEAIKRETFEFPFFIFKTFFLSSDILQKISTIQFYFSYSI